MRLKFFGNKQVMCLKKKKSIKQRAGWDFHSGYALSGFRLAVPAMKILGIAPSTEVPTDISDPS